MSKEMNKDIVMKVNRDLAIVRQFSSRRAFNELALSCMHRIPMSLLPVEDRMKFGRGRLTFRPSMTDYLKSMTYLSEFLEITEERGAEEKTGKVKNFKEQIDKEKNVNENCDREDNSKEDNSSKNDSLLNTKGFHSDTVVACMDALLKCNSFCPMEKLVDMLDENEEDLQIRNIRKMLLTTSNNMDARKLLSVREKVRGTTA